MKQQKQSGFAHLMIITIILGLGLVGTLGFVFYQNFVQNKNDTSQEVISENKKDQENVEVIDEVASWAKFDTDYFTMPIPDGWKLQKNVISETNKDFGFILTPYNMNAGEALTYSKGARASVETVKESQYAGHGISSSFTLNYVAVIRGEDESMPLENNGYTKVSTFVSNSGISVDKYHQYFAKRPSEMIEGPIVDGSNDYIYRFKINGMTVQIEYCVAPDGQPDNTTQLEQALKALTVK